MPKITSANHNNLPQFILDNLQEFNESNKPFEFNKIREEYKALGFSDADVISATMMRQALIENYRSLLRDDERKERFEEELKSISETTISKAKDEFKKIALKYQLNAKHVEAHYIEMIKTAVISGFYKCQDKWKNDTLKLLLGFANSLFESNNQLPGKIVKGGYENSISQIEYWLLNMGFSQNITNEVKGQDIANQGDSAQFIFVGRAILAGFNCSNVDVRSSSYDAIISTPNSNGKASNLKTVQIKGIASGKSLSLLKRPRGGSGSDSTSGRNVAKPLSPEDADLLVAVDKQFGTCFIIPMDDVEYRINNGCTEIPWNELEKHYKERWETIS